MSNQDIEWGCCNNDDNDVLEEHSTCSVCGKAFHLACLQATSKQKINIKSFSSLEWLCILCKGKKAKDKKSKVDTPVRSLDCLVTEHVSSRSNKRPALSSPPTSSDVIGTHELIKDTIKDTVRLEISEAFSQLNKTWCAHLSSELKTLRDEMKDINDAVNFMNKQYEEAIGQLKSSAKVIKDLKEKNISLHSEINVLNNRINVLEQHARSNNIEIQCLPENKNENLFSIVSKIGSVIGCTVDKEHIRNVTRTAKFKRDNNRPRSIVVEFNSKTTRDSFLASIIKFNRDHTEDKLNTSHVSILGPKQAIYIVEHLSPTYKHIFAATRIKAKEKGYRYVWTRNGNIFVRKDDTSHYIIVKSLDTLNTLV